MNKNDEQILVISRDALFDSETITFQGFASGTLIVSTMLTQLDRAIVTMRRGYAEDNPRFKQPIPYVVLRCGDSVFGYTRLAGGGEERLHGKISIGVGGHMNPVDGAVTFSKLLQENMMRELDEEVEFEKDGSTWYVAGFINDDTNSVGKVHIGVFVVYELSKPDVRVKETESLEGKWYKISDLKQPELYERLENWSKIAVDVLLLS